MPYVRNPLPIRNVGDLSCKQGIADGHKTDRFKRSGFGPMFAAEILRNYGEGM
jgi:hypothetical protein